MEEEESKASQHFSREPTLYNKIKLSTYLRLRTRASEGYANFLLPGLNIRVPILLRC